MDFAVKLKELKARLAPAPPRYDTSLWSRATSVGRAVSTSTALAFFLAGFTLDDLHLFRVPVAYVGLGLAVLAFAFMPPLVAQRLLLRARADAPGHESDLLDRAVIRQRAVLVFVVIGFVAWLVLFASGKTPRW